MAIGLSHSPRGMGRVAWFASLFLSWKVPGALVVIVLVAGASGLVARRESLAAYYHAFALASPPVLVITSDDWGGPARETAADLQRLGDTLRQFTDAYGHHPVLTTYVTPAEPDFERIAAGGYAAYAWRSAYEGKPDVVSAWRALAEEGLLEIQLHGREHWNVPLGMEALRRDVPGFRNACRDKRVPYRHDEAGRAVADRDPRFRYLASSFADATRSPLGSLSLETQEAMVRDAVGLIEEDFGVRPTVAVPPNLVWDINTWKALRAAGLAYLEVAPAEVIEVDEDLRRVRTGTYLRWGNNAFGVKPVLRNCFYEPGSAPDPAEVAARARATVGRLLALGTPVVITTHAENYVAAGSQAEASLAGLADLLRGVQTESPDVAFLGASDLGRYMYDGGVGAAREIPFKRGRLSLWGRLGCVFVILWVRQSFRIWVCALVVGVAWLVAAYVLGWRRRSEAKQ